MLLIAVTLCRFVEATFPSPPTFKGKALGTRLRVALKFNVVQVVWSVQSLRQNGVEVFKTFVPH